MRKLGWIIILVLVVALVAYAFAIPFRNVVNNVWRTRISPSMGNFYTNLKSSPFWQTYIKGAEVFYGMIYGVIALVGVIVLFGRVRERIPIRKPVIKKPVTFDRPMGSYAPVASPSVTEPATNPPPAPTEPIVEEETEE